MHALSADLKARVEAMQWRGHSIRLDDDTVTRDDWTPVAESVRYATVMQVFETIVGDPAGKRIADMGALEGGFSLALAERGADVVGFEARQTNMRKLDILTEHFALPNLRFEQADVKDVTVKTHDRWDVVLALRILHHLDEPAKWLARMAQATDAIVVETLVAPRDDELAEHAEAAKLSSLREQKRSDFSYTGRWYREFSPDQDPEPLLLAAWSNPDSFWLTRESLIQAFVDAGFTSVFQFTNRYLVTTSANQRTATALVAATRTRPPA